MDLIVAGCLLLALIAVLAWIIHPDRDPPEHQPKWTPRQRAMLDYAADKLDLPSLREK